MVVTTIFTLNEVAELLSCHKETVRREVKAGRLRAAKIGKEYRVSKTDLEVYWADCGGGKLFDEPLPAYVLHPHDVPNGEHPDGEPEEQVEPEKPKGPEQLKLPT